MEKAADRLLRGAIDIHAHSYPEHTLSTPSRLDNLEWAKMAREYGMRGFVMKSHIWPTAAQAYEIGKMIDGIEVMGSITLNYTVGGLSPTAAAIAGELGAKIVFMPTWSAKNDIARSGVMLNRIRKICPHVDQTIRQEGGEGISVLDPNGKVTEVVKEIFSIAKSYDMAVSSGHLSIEESMKLAEVAAEKQVRFVLSHPHNRTISATAEQQKRIADLGGFVEHTFIACMPMHLRVDPKEIANSIQIVGAGRTVITSDSFGPWNPPAPEILRMFVATLLALNFSEDDISRMVKDNPARVLNLPQ
jgi:hypothetical protein